MAIYLPYSEMRGSPPSRGAWIEIWGGADAVNPSRSRPLRGGRGLKCHGKHGDQHPRQSPPSRGAWIEMSTTPTASRRRRSPPSRGAWIEIWQPQRCQVQRSSPPSRGRGLKCIVFAFVYRRCRRPPREGARIEIAAHTAPRRSRPSPLRPVCPPGAPSCRPEKSSFVPSVVMYPVSFQLYVLPKNSFADFT